MSAGGITTHAAGRELERARARLADVGLSPPRWPASAVGLYARMLALEGVSLGDCLCCRDLLRISEHGGQAPAWLHALLLALFWRKRRGRIRLLLAPGPLREDFELLAGEAAPALVEAALAACARADPCPGLIAREDARLPLVLDARGGEPALYFARYWDAEQRLWERLRALADREPPEAPVRARAREAALRAAACGSYSLAGEQVAAVYLALTRGLTVIGGGPGTGKTTLVCSLLRALLATGVAPDRIALAAPTGRAGQRLGEAIAAEIDGLGREQEPAARRERIRRMSGTTIHHLLGFHPGRNRFIHGPANPLPLEVLIVDEVSMIDVCLMQNLVAALPADARLVLLGDPYQLPSVEAGAVLPRLLPREREPTFSRETAAELRELLADDFRPRVCATGEAAAGKDRSPVTSRAGLLHDHALVLERNHRFRGALGATCARLRQGGEPAALLEDAQAFTPTPLDVRNLSLPGAGRAHAVLGADWLDPRWRDTCRRLLLPAGGTGEAVEDVVLSWTHAWFTCGEDDAAHPRASYFALVRRAWEQRELLDPEGAGSAGMLRALFTRLRAARILTFLREGRRGVGGINACLAHAWRGCLDPAAEYGACFAGMPVMVLANSRARGLYNGDVGVVLAVADGTRVAVFERGREFLTLACALLPPHEAAFACTVHKSQGSQYGRVLLVMPRERDHPLFSREIIYTALTRARECACVLPGLDAGGDGAHPLPPGGDAAARASDPR